VNPSYHHHYEQQQQQHKLCAQRQAGFDALFVYLVTFNSVLPSTLLYDVNPLSCVDVPVCYLHA